MNGKQRIGGWRLLPALLMGAALWWPGAPAAADDDVDMAAAERAYMRECSNCHGRLGSDAQSGLTAPEALLVPVMMPALGPDLTGMFGSHAASREDYRYTEAFVAATTGLVWDEQSLDQLLRDAQAMAPGTSMAYKQSNPRTRGQVIAYLKANR